MTLHEAMIIA